VRVDVHGNSVAALNTKGKPGLIWRGTSTRSGIQITHIDDEAFSTSAASGMGLAGPG